MPEPDGLGIVVISRPKAWGGKWHRWDVIVSGQKTASLGNGDQHILRLEAGEHGLRVDNGRRHASNTIRFEIAAGATLEVTGREPGRRARTAGPLGRFTPVLEWVRQTAGARVFGDER